MCYHTTMTLNYHSIDKLICNQLGRESISNVFLRFEILFVVQLIRSRGMDETRQEIQQINNINSIQ